MTKVSPTEKASKLYIKEHWLGIGQRLIPLENDSLIKGFGKAIRLMI